MNEEVTKDSIIETKLKTLNKTETDPKLLTELLLINKIKRISPQKHIYSEIMNILNENKTENKSVIDSITKIYQDEINENLDKMVKEYEETKTDIDFF